MPLPLGCQEALEDLINSGRCIAKNNTINELFAAILVSVNCGPIAPVACYANAEEMQQVLAAEQAYYTINNRYGSLVDIGLGALQGVNYNYTILLQNGDQRAWISADNIDASCFAVASVITRCNNAHLFKTWNAPVGSSVPAAPFPGVAIADCIIAGAPVWT